MRRTVPMFLLALGLLLAATAPVAEAHLPPPAYFTIGIGDERTEVTLVVQYGVFRDWFGVQPADVPRDGVFDEERHTAIEAALRRWLRVRVDGLLALGALQETSVEELLDHEVTWRFVKLRVVFPTQVPPKQVAFAWMRYSDSTNYYFDEIDAELDAYGKSYYPLFRDREPEYIWHRPREVAEPAPPVLPRPREPPHVTVPLVSAALAIALLLLLFLRRRRLSPGIVVGLLLVGAVAVVQLRPLARVDVPLPFGGAPGRPPEAEALTIFASLHRGVYDALDGETEDEIYDELAAGVTGELLPRLYMDIHESMILHEEGGAVAKVEKTEIVESALLPDEEAGAAWFKVHARWRVEGKVGHFGHTHRRINEYLADVTVVAIEGRWKLAAIEVLDETRVDDGEPVGRGEPDEEK